MNPIHHVNPVQHASATSTSQGHGHAASPSTTETLTGQNRLATTAGFGASPHQAPTTHPSVDGNAGEARNFVRLNLPAINTQLPVEQRAAEVRRLAIEAFPQCDNWVLFYREVFGVDGVIRKLFATVDELKVWESSPEFYETHEMLAALRSQDNGKGDTIEPQRMITVRLPVSMHEAMKLESAEVGLSINKLCITKMLQKLDSRFAPQEPGKRRGRKPGPQGKRTVKTVD